MSDLHAALYTYMAPLHEPLPFVGGSVLSHREGIIVHVRTAGGQSAFGDIAPLPGFSRESRDEALEAACEAVDFINTHDEWPARIELPSVDFGVYGARWNLEYLQGKHRPAVEEVHVNGLILESGALAVERAIDLRMLGYTTVKLKVGRAAVPEDIERTLAVAKALEPFPLRLDANRAWDLPTALRFAHGVRDAAVEYMEEPLKSTEDLPAFSRETGLPIALDETLATVSEMDWAAHGVKIFVLKPTLLGMTRSLQLAEEARRQGFKTVFSSCFESGVGVGTLALMAACYSDGVPAGLDTYGWILGDVLERRLEYKGGVVNAAEVVSAMETVAPDRLEPVK